MDIYVLIVQAYFVADMKLETMEKIYKNDLLKYEHHTHDGIITFKTPLEAIIAIIQCENISHKQAKRFNPVKYKAA